MRAAIAVLLALTAPVAAEPRTHDGVYLRLGVGPNFASGTLDTAADSSTDGFGVATQLAIGWTVRRGLVVGVGTFPMVNPAPSYDGIAAGGQHISATGPFVDYYVDPRKGLHVQAGLLLAVGYLDGGDREGNVGAGVAGTAGVGYEVFVSDEWSLGGVVRVTAYQLFGVDESIRLFAPAALLTLTRH
jgi:hypothetical protein